MRRRMLWLGVLVGGALMAWSLTLAGPWAGMPVGVVLAAGCGTTLADG